MADEVKERLRELINTQGQQIYDNPSRFSSLMLDLCLGSSEREINILAIALTKKIPQYLQSSGGQILTEELRSNLSNRLEIDCALQVDAAIWAVNTWAEASGMITGEYSELKNTKNRRTTSESEDTDRPLTPNSNTRYVVVSGAFVKDHLWHELSLPGYPNWLENLLPMLSSGKIVDDGVFEFGFNASNKYYEIRLKNDYSQQQYDNRSSKLVDYTRRVRLDSWIEDHYWHPLYYEQMNPWLQKRVRELDRGKLIRAVIFEYRRNFSAEQYEISVQSEKPLPQLYKRL